MVLDKWVPPRVERTNAQEGTSPPLIMPKSEWYLPKIRIEHCGTMTIIMTAFRIITLNATLSITCCCVSQLSHKPVMLILISVSMLNVGMPSASVLNVSILSANLLSVIMLIELTFVFL